MTRREEIEAALRAKSGASQAHLGEQRDAPEVIAAYWREFDALVKKIIDPSPNIVLR